MRWWKNTIKSEGTDMNRHKLQAEFDWQRWKSSAQDVKKLPSLLAARLLFDILLINKFEHELLQLKNNDCVWGPVHSSVGQEAVAAATMAALRREDKITGSHRAHHQFLSKSRRNRIADEPNTNSHS